MAYRLNNVLFAPRGRRLTPAAWWAIGAAAVLVAAVALVANWGSVLNLFKDDVTLYQEAYNSGRFDDALEVALRMAEEDPTSPEAQRAVAAVYLQMALDGTDFDASLEAADNAARAAEQLDRGAPETKRILGFIAELRGDLAAAADEYLAVLDEDPLNASALAQLAWVYEREGSLEEARVTYQRAVTADPQNEQARLYYARHLFATGDPVGAIAQAQTATSSEKIEFAAEANRIVSASYLAQGELAEARPPAERALALSPNSAQAILNYAELRLAELFGPTRMPFAETLAEVRALADRAAAIDPTLAMAPFLAYKAAYSQGDKAAADEYSARALRLLPQDSTLSTDAKEAIKLFIKTVPTVRVTPRN